jgi:hypothetical protein
LNRRCGPWKEEALKTEIDDDIERENQRPSSGAP